MKNTLLLALTGFILSLSPLSASANNHYSISFTNETDYPISYEITYNTRALPNFQAKGTLEKNTSMASEVKRSIKNPLTMITFTSQGKELQREAVFGIDFDNKNWLHKELDDHMPYSVIQEKNGSKGIMVTGYRVKFTE